MNDKFLNNAKFTYTISYSEDMDLENHFRIPYKKMVLNYSRDTDFLYSENEKNKVYILGFCIDCHGEIERNRIPEELIQNSSDINECLAFSRRFAGNFVILVDFNDEWYIFNDAIGAMQINYATVDDKIYFASTDALLSLRLNLPISKDAINSSRQARTAGYELPYDVTFYENIKVLLPNHYMYINENKIIRYYPKDSIDTIYDSKYVAEKTITLHKNIVREYHKEYNLLGSLTSGNDSRIVLSLLKSYGNDTSYYTFKHKYFDNNHQDIKVPQDIAKKFGLDYKIINHTSVPKEFSENVKKYVGPTATEFRIQLANTFTEHFPNNYATLNGNIFEEIGRNKMDKGCPSFLISPSLAMKFSYNTSRFAYKLYKKQFKSFFKAGYRKNAMDLLAWENMCGRRIADSMKVYFVAGANILNICNCREILELWLLLDKRKRINKEIHVNIIEKLCPELLNFPINPMYKAVPKWKDNCLYDLASSKLYLLYRMRKK